MHKAGFSTPHLYRTETDAFARDDTPALGPQYNDGRLLQGLNYLCNNGFTVISEKPEKLLLQGAQHPRNLDPPLPSCYLPAEAFSFPAFH